MKKQLFTGADIYAAANEKIKYSAMLTEGGKIIALYSKHSKIPEDLEADYIDLAGKCIIPSLTDCHTHSFEGGLYSLCTDMTECRSIADALDLIGSAESIDGKIMGWSYQADKILQKRLPSMTELDSISSNVPVIVRRIDGHSCMINSCACKLIFGTNFINVPDPVSGFTTVENHIIVHWFLDTLSSDVITQAYRQAEQIALQAGLGRIHTMVSDGKDGPGHYDFISSLSGSFFVDFDFYPQIFDIDAVLRLGSPRIGGCILADGSFGSHTAALGADYADRPGVRGVLRQNDSFWTDMYRRCTAAGLDLCIHAIGDAAIEQLLRCALRAGVRAGDGRRHQLIHNELVPDKLLSLLEQTGHIALMQPAFDLFWGGGGGLYDQVLGSRRKYTNRFRTLLDHGICIAGGSDWYITPLDAFSGIYAAENHHNPNERISRAEALAMYTANAAYAGRHEHTEGVLRPGYNADFLVLDQDFFTCTDVRSLQVLQHYRKGLCIYSC